VNALLAAGRGGRAARNEPIDEAPATPSPRAIPRFSEEQPPSHVTGPHARGAAVAVARQRDAATVAKIEPHAGERREEPGTEKK
jgi:hypothetical protein